MARHFLYFIFFHSNEVVGRHQYINIHSEQMVLLPSFLPLSESPGALSEWKSPFHSCEPPKAPNQHITLNLYHRVRSFSIRFNQIQKLTEDEERRLFKLEPDWRPPKDRVP
jgi:hypothetical protein